MFFSFLSIIVNCFFLSAVKADALRAQLFNLIKKRYFIIVSLFGSSSKARTCDIHSLKLIVSSLLRKVLNNSFCTFIRLLFLPLAAQSSSAVKANALRARLLTFYTYFKFSLIVKQKRVENLLFFILAPQARLELATSRLTAVRSTNWAIEEYKIKFWRRPIFPAGNPTSIFGTLELNFCVRHGYRCFL